MSEVVNAEEEMQILFGESDKAFEKAIAIADKYGFAFYYAANGQGYYRANLTREQCLKYVESGDLDKLSDDTQEHIREFLASDEEKYNNDDNYESWQTSFC